MSLAGAVFINRADRKNAVQAFDRVAARMKRDNVGEGVTGSVQILIALLALIMDFPRGDTLQPTFP